MGNIVDKVLLVMRLFFAHKVFIFFFFVRVINSLLNSKCLNWPKPKAFADNNMFLLGWKESIVEKGMRLFFSHNEVDNVGAGENTSHQHFLPS